MKIYKLIVLSVCILMLNSCTMPEFEIEEDINFYEFENLVYGIINDKEPECGVTQLYSAIEPEVIAPENPDLITENHIHNYSMVEFSDSDCSKTGYSIEKCECGAAIKRAIPKKAHTPTESTCLTPSYCSVCGVQLSQTVPHSTENGVCSQCGLDFSKEVKLCSRPLSFSDTESYIRKSFGAPEEILTEGEIKTFLYFTNTDKFTAIEFKSGCVYGYYSFDMDSYIKYDSQKISPYNSGYKKVPDLYARQGTVGDIKCTVFYDSFKDSSPFAIWVRNEKMSYNYLEDENIFSNYYPQEKLSFYILNSLRIINNLPTVSESAGAKKVAYEYSLYMAEKPFFGHDFSFLQRLKDAGIAWNHCAENISLGYENAFFVMSEYYNSSDHRHNILESEYSNVGIAYVKSNGAVYGAEEFFG